MKKTKKNYIIIVLVVLLLALAIGYATFSSTLSITGTATGTATWDVNFTSAQMLGVNDAVDSNHGTATVSADGQTVTVAASLAYPGDAIKLRTVITNSGTVDAELTGYNITGNNDTDISITEAKDTIGSVIKANGGTCTSEFVIKWKTDSAVTNLGTKNFSITFTYSQPNEVNLTPSHSHTPTT